MVPSPTIGGRTCPSAGLTSKLEDFPFLRETHFFPSSGDGDRSFLLSLERDRSFFELPRSDDLLRALSSRSRDLGGSY